MNNQISTPPGAFWDEKYAGEDYFYGTEPNRWLAAQAHRLTPGMAALSIADGEGRNGVWLAKQGLSVTTVDASTRAVAKAGALAAAQNVETTRIQADLTTWDWPVGQFDVCVSIFAHFRPGDREQVHGRLLAALKPGGLVMLEAYTPYQHIYKTGGPPFLEMLYTAYTLERDFAGTEILERAELTTDVREGSGHRGTASVVRFIARKI